ncbi:MAG: NADH-quinone oxidoreductase subunit NuoE [Actinomycetota bacterium]
MAVLSPELRARAEDVKARYPDTRSAMMPLLYLVQSVEGHVSREGMREVGEILGVTAAEVEAVASFYTMIRRRPTGRYVISVCTNLSCALVGAKGVFERAQELLGPDAGGMTEDGMFTLHEEECLGACDGAPVVQVNWMNYDRVDEARIAELIESIRRGEVPSPSRGEVPADVRDTSRRLAGLGGSDG